MKYSFFILLSLSLVFSSCKKEEDPAGGGSTALPSGNFVKIGGSTYLENQWFSPEKYYDPVGERYSNIIYLDAQKSDRFLVTFHGQPIVGNDYFLDPELGLDKTDRAAVGYRKNGINWVAKNNGKLTVTMKDGKKLIELSGHMNVDGVSTSVDARFVWIE